MLTNAAVQAAATLACQYLVSRRLVAFITISKRSGQILDQQLQGQHHLWLSPATASLAQANLVLEDSPGLQLKVTGEFATAVGLS